MREKPMIEEMKDRSPRSGGSTIEPDTVVMRDLHALDDRVLAGRYELRAVLGRGAKGVVYLGHDRVLRRDVAIKVLYRDIAGEDDTLERFRQEARLGARVNHPNAVAIFDTGVHEGQPFIVMECLSGETLAARIAVKPLPPRQVRDIGTQLLRALDAAHRRGVIHRDIKPANVLFTSTGKVKVADFGIATATDNHRVTRTGLVVGTLAYLAPERLQGAAATPQSDIYAAGVVLYEALTGRKPFEADSPAALLNQISSTSAGHFTSVQREVSARLMRVLTRALQEDPKARYATAGAMAHALERAPIVRPRSCLPPPPPVATIVMPPAVADRRRHRRSSMLVSMAFVATAAGVGVFVVHDLAFSDPTKPTSPPSTAPAATVAEVVPLVSTTVVTTTAPPTTTVATTTLTSTTRATSTTVRATTTQPATTTTATTRNSKGKGKGRND